jgi:hypothetical protein
MALEHDVRVQDTIVAKLDMRPDDTIRPDADAFPKRGQR